MKLFVPNHTIPSQVQLIAEGVHSRQTSESDDPFIWIYNQLSPLLSKSHRQSYVPRVVFLRQNEQVGKKEVGYSHHVWSAFRKQKCGDRKISPISRSTAISRFYAFVNPKKINRILLYRSSFLSPRAPFAFSEQISITRKSIYNKFRCESPVTIILPLIVRKKNLN